MWLSEYSTVVVERLEMSISDHYPQLLGFDTHEPRRGLFRFYNVIVDHEQFKAIVRANWGLVTNPNLLRGVWMKCQKLKGPFKKLNT